MDDRHFGYIKKLNKKPSPHANVKVTYIDINGQNWIFEVHNKFFFYHPPHKLRFHLCLLYVVLVWVLPLIGHISALKTNS
jgi:hypothetical protein